MYVLVSTMVDMRKTNITNLDGRPKVLCLGLASFSSYDENEAIRSSNIIFGSNLV